MPRPRSPKPAAAAPPGFGETHLVAGCLHISASAYRGRQGDFDNHDWVTMEVVNRCETSLRHPVVELRLFDAQGNFYGRRIWLPGRRERPRPGGRRTERYAIPAPNGRVAAGWEIKVLNRSSRTNGGRAASEARRGKPGLAAGPYTIAAARLLVFCPQTRVEWGRRGCE